MTSKTVPVSKLSKILPYVLPALTLALGLQLLHVFVPSMVWYLRDVNGVATLGLLPYAFAPFVLAMFAGALRRTAGPRLSLLITSGGVAVLRLAEQVSRNSALDLWLSIAGLTCLFMFLPLFIGHARSLGAHTNHRWVFGFLLGFELEVSLRALYGFRPLSSVDGFLPLIIVALFSLSILIALWREPFGSNQSASETLWASALSLAIFGPFMVLQVLMLGSHGYLAEVAGLNPELSFAVVIFGYVAACFGVYLGYRNPHALHPIVAVLFAAYLGVSSFLAGDLGRYFILVVLLSQGYAGFGLALIGNANAKGVRRGLFKTTFSSGSGMILFLILVFGYYVAQDIALPFSRSMFPAIAGVVAGLLVLQASTVVRSRAVTAFEHWNGLIAAAALLLIPLGYWIFTDSNPSLETPGGGSVRVMTYNIHSGYNVQGQPDLEAIARVIESGDADIVGLQEVSRARFMDASVDMPVWLARRLDMAYVFRGTEEPIWGNAILSRYPIIDWGWGDLPRAGKLIGRGYIWARIDVGGPEPVLVIATHLHHLDPDSKARQEQVPGLLQFWNGRSYSILLGDMNAEPGSPEMEMIAEAGFKDAWKHAGDGQGYTFSSIEPVKRIDWLWHSDGLTPIELEVIQTQASDHMPVQAVFSIR
jgi:endonuclease/exonuclease/phosphatase family metal-dependent hydrolase